MKTENIPLLGIERFKEHPEYVSYLDNDIAVIDSLSDMIEANEEAIKLDCLIIVFCQEGKLTIHANGEIHQLQKDYCAIFPPGIILRKLVINQSYTLKIAAASRTFLTNAIGTRKETWDIMQYLFSHPIFPVKQKSSYKMYLYKELLLTLIQEKQHVYSKQTRRFHFAGMFCEMMAEIHKTISPKHHLSTTANRGIGIVRDFMSLVNADNGTHRSVSYYADRLHYTAKYLSTVIKQTTGKRPLQIINEHAIKEIKYQLKYSDMRMKEMSNFFGFPNPSFFAKFVKAHTGMTPLEIRISEEETE